MVEILGDVVAIFDIRYGGQRFENVGGKAVTQQLYRELHGGAGLGGPKSRG